MSKHCWIIYWSYSYLAKLYIFYGFANISNGILTNWRKQKKKHFKYVSYGIDVNLLKALVKIISYLKEKSCSMILRRRKKNYGKMSCHWSIKEHICATLTWRRGKVERDIVEFNMSADTLIINCCLINYEMRILLALSRR